MVEDTLRLFSSVYFAVSLFAVWGVLTLIGVIVDQGKDAQFYWSTYSAPLARLVLRLHLDNIYHSTPYVGIIGLILASLAVCTFKRVIPARLPPLRSVKIEHIPLHADVSVRGEEGAIRSAIEAFFSERGWTIRKRELGGEEWTFADKHNWARRGVLIAHLGFVIITAGTTWYWAQGFSGDTAIVTGQTVTVPRSGARLTLDRFAYRIDPISTKSGTVYQPIDYVSTVRYIGRDGFERPATIRVNSPLNIDGTLFYQATYGYAVNFRLTKGSALVPGSPLEPVKEGEAFRIEGTDKAVQYAGFVGTIDPKTKMPGPDPRPNNPGVAIRFYSGDTPVAEALLPIGKSLDLGNGYRLEATRFTPFTGLQYRYDPGVPLVGIGAFVLLAGLCISLYFLPARLYIRVTGSGRAWNVGGAATTVKGYDVYEDEFRDLIGALHRTLTPPHRQPSTAPAPSSA